MELITYLILLAVLLVPPLFLAGREILGKLYFYVTATLGKFRDAKELPARYADGWETPPVYDGTVTIEIPAPRDQIIAYEPLLDDGDIALLDYPSRASRA